MNADKTTGHHPSVLWVQVRSELDLPEDFPKLNPSGITQIAAQKILSESEYDQLLEVIFQSDSIIVT